MRSVSRLRAAVLATAVNLGTVDPAYPLRFLRVPAIYLVLRREIHRVCHSRACRRKGLHRRRGAKYNAR